MKRVLFFLALNLTFYPKPHAQNIREILERPWWGQGSFETEMVMPGVLIVSFELKEVRIDSGNILTGKLIQKIVLEEETYHKTSFIHGLASPEHASAEIQEHRVLTASALPEPFEWPATTLSLKAGYDPDRPSGFALKGLARWGTLKGEVEFRDYPFTH